MDPILILRHDEIVPPGWLGSVLEDAGVPTVVAPLHEGAEMPAPTGWSGIVSLGGSMGAYDEAEYPFLAAEKDMLRVAVAAGVPVLGLCLGCQVLADALGGRAYEATRPEVAFTTVSPTAAGTADPVVAALDRPVVVWHEDTWDLPPGGTLLASTDRYPQAFRLGSALGLQPHPEATPDVAAGWGRTASGRDTAARAGTDLDAMLDRVEAGEAESAEMARAVFGAWLDEVRTVAATRTA